MSDILLGADGKPIIVQKDGKPVFLGKEDPNNPPTVTRNPNNRYCKRCKNEDDNSHAMCSKCGSYFDDSKMECPVCHKWFDYLVGSNDYGGIQGCEAHWKPPKEKGVTYGQKTGETKDISFD